MCIEYHCYIMLINKLFDCEVLKLKLVEGYSQLKFQGECLCNIITDRICPLCDVIEAFCK